MEKKQFKIALAGNPNAGKTTLFNALTGARQHVGNWPGKTVEQKSGWFRHGGVEIEVIDLPGTYSLSAFSPEEVIARDFMINEQPDLVVIVLDAANLERNLYLAVQVLELEVRAVIVLNMLDMAEARGYQIDTAELSRRLHAPVLTAVARTGHGVDDLKELLLQQLQERMTAYGNA